ncbi:MAG TPA: tetratricopeptide repeat protein [Roseiflexaceae bacterium]|nr:tetratricopeptide repeat protein [Roseiflexaceae bacterium]
MDASTSFGAWLRRRRRALDITQAELAQRAGCAPVTIKSIEADARRPSKQLAERLAKVLELAPEERALFLKVARAELSADRLALPKPAARAVGRKAPQSPPPAEQAALPTGTVTFLFTDLEGSTRLWEQHPQAMRVALARHDTLLGEAVAANRGVIVKSTGDGILAAFASAPDALAAALAAQRALQQEAWGATGPLRARIALHTGIPEERNADYFGPALNRASRLLAATHGGQILLSRATWELVSDYMPVDVELRDLGVHRLKDLSHPEQLFQVVAPDLQSEFPPLQTLAADRTNVPVPPNLLIGREREIAAVAMLLRRSDVRLVTLTGPGGIGKTRLAMQVAAALHDAYVDGVWFVDLAPIRDPALVLPRIVQTLSLKEFGGSPPLAQLQGYLRDKQLLLLLDNFEQVVDAAVDIAELVATCPGLKVVCTSRMVLHLYGEHVFEVPPLGLPERKQLQPRGMDLVDAIGQYEAVRLFVERAQAVKADFTLTAANAMAIIEICQRLDGLPLAIELAAAWIRLFSPQALLARLTSRLDLLRGGAKDRPDRQQTLRKTIDWSYALLDPAEQMLFQRLAVFIGGCTLTAAEEVCTGGESREDEVGLAAESRIARLPNSVLDGLASLVDKTMLRQFLSPDGEPRFMMFETIHEYARAQLDMSAEAEALRQRHAIYYLVLSEAAEPELWGSQQEQWLDRLEADHDNLRAALGWSLQEVSVEHAEAKQSSRGLDTSSLRHTIGLRLAGALWWFWVVHGHVSEGRAWLASALSQATERSAARARALLGAGFLADIQGDYAVACALFEESLAVARTVGDQHTQAHVLILLALVVLSQQGNHAHVLALLEEGLALSKTLGDKRTTAYALFGLGRLAYYQEDYVRAAQLYAESLALYQELGHIDYISIVLSNLGLIALAQGDYTRATELLLADLAACQRLRNNRGGAWALYHLGSIALEQGDHAQAQAYYTESLMLRWELGDRRGIADCLEGLAALASIRGQAESAAQLCGAAEVLWKAIGDARVPANQMRYQRTVAAALAGLGEEQFMASKAAGQQLSLEHVVASRSAALPYSERRFQLRTALPQLSLSH